MFIQILMFMPCSLIMMSVLFPLDLCLVYFMQIIEFCKATLKWFTHTRTVSKQAGRVFISLQVAYCICQYIWEINLVSWIKYLFSG